MTALAMASNVTAVADADFRRYQRLILEATGIHLADSKRALLAGRLARRLRELGLSTYGEYFDRVHRDAAERERMLDLIVTNETSFFRETPHFTFISQTLVPAWIADSVARRREPVLRIWSAGCSTGDEPYSLAMLLHHQLQGWDLDILATDLSKSALQRGEQGMWPIAKAAAIPEELLRRYMLRGVGEKAGVMKISSEIKHLVRFRRVNLNDGVQLPSGAFDLLFCRNVLIYFEAEARRRALERLIAACATGGYLFIGHAETLQGFPAMRNVQPTIWRKIG